MVYASGENHGVTTSKPVRVNGVLIDEAEIFREAQNHPDESWESACDAATRALVVRELLLQEARDCGVGRTLVSISSDQEPLEDEALIQALIDSNIEVPEAGREECHRYYTNNREKFQDGPWFHARHILVKVDPSVEDGLQCAQRQAEQIIEMLRKILSGFQSSPAATLSVPRHLPAETWGE